tara:strand:- start:230 stop:451 length:222 start_codon:yes stop_codon:yes gene_type:complete
LDKESGNTRTSYNDDAAANVRLRGNNNDGTESGMSDNGYSPDGTSNNVMKRSLHQRRQSDQNYKVSYDYPFLS